MATDASRVTDLRQQQIRQNEAQVLAEQSLRAERVIAWVRVALAVGIIGAVAVAKAVEPEAFSRLDPVRSGAAVAYALFAVVLALAMRRMKPTPRRQLFGPLASIAADFSFSLFMLLRRIDEDGQLEPGMLVGVGCVFIAFSIFRFSLMHSVVTTALTLGVVGTCVAYADLRGVAVDSSGIAFGVVGLFLLGVLVGAANRSVRRMFVELRRRENLARFLPRQVAERVLQLSGAPLDPVQREVTILFVDVRDFTSLSERMPPAQVLDFLNVVLGELAQIVKGHDGVVNKFLGDGMLAVWGVPERDPEHALHAVRAAQDMLVRVEELSGAALAEGKPAIRVGIGIHTGVVAAGMIGGADQHEYTVIGDAVNLASRIEGLTKTHGAPLLLSETTAKLLGDRLPLRAVGEAQVKGRVQTVTLFAVDQAASARAATGS